MIMINSEPYNKFLNKRTGISQNYIMTEIKEELINTYEFQMNKNDDNINEINEEEEFSFFNFIISASYYSDRSFLCP